MAAMIVSASMVSPASVTTPFMVALLTPVFRRISIPRRRNLSAEYAARCSGSSGMILGSMLDQNDPDLIRSNIAIVLQRVPDQVLNLADGLDPGKTRAHGDDGKQARLAHRVRLGIRVLEALEDMIADAKSIHHVLHHERAFGEAGRAAEVDHLAEGDHQLVVGDGGDLVTAAGGHVNRLGREVDLADLRDPHFDAGKECAQRAYRIGRLDAAAGHLGQQWLKHEEVVAADEFHLHIAAGTRPQVLGGKDPAKSSTKNNDPARLGIVHRPPSVCDRPPTPAIDGAGGV